jgi:Recombination, repair and ssDNA binding protein UvsY
MTLEHYADLWEKDADIDQSNAGEESLRIPVLHHKYMKQLSIERMKKNRLVEKHKILISKIEGYYRGQIDGKDIGREPYLLTHRTNDEIRRKLEADEELIRYNIAIMQQEEIVQFLISVIAQINQRNYIIKNYIDFLKFTNGAG